MPALHTGRQGKRERAPAGAVLRDGAALGLTALLLAFLPAVRAAPAADLTGAFAVESFDAFSRQWMEKLSRAQSYRRSNRMRFEKTPRGFLAEYVGYDLASRQIRVKPTDSRPTPFIGVLTYNETVLRSFGRSREKAAQGPFTVVETRPVMEVFRYSAGRWEY